MAMSNSNFWLGSWTHSEPVFPNIFPEPVERIKYPQRQRNGLQDHQDITMNTFLPFLLTLGLSHPSHTSTSPPHPPFHETSGAFRTVYRWKQLDFEFPSEEVRLEAEVNEKYIQKNNLPLGIETWRDKVFLSMPKWKAGVPATLAWLPRIAEEESPKLKPYPNWDWHTTESCKGLTSVFRMEVDSCNRLWVLDSGQIEVTIKPIQVCPPQIVIFDLNTDKLIRRHVFRDKHIKEDSLYSNIVVDVRDDDCVNVHAYVSDVWRFGLLVYSFEKDKSWRITNHLFFPDPLAAAYKLHDLEFAWTDGIFGIALSPYDKHLNDRILYFHPMSGFREFYVKTSVVCNETGWEDAMDEYKVLGQSRGRSGHVSGSAMDRNGILYFNYVSRDSVGCWDSRKAYKRENLGVIAKNSTTMVFPNDLRLDKEKRQGIWIITNKLPFYLYRGLDEDEYNFRVMHAYTDEAIKGTICDPKFSRPGSYREYTDGEDCY